MNNDYIISDEYDGARRKLYRVSCSYCANDFYRPRHTIKDRNYCSPACSYTASRKRVTMHCDRCGKEFTKTPSAIKDHNFCSRGCKDKAQRIGGILSMRPPHYKNGIRNYRDKALREFGATCNVCGYVEYEELLVVHHIDMNRDNNVINNLEVLCVWCHALRHAGIPRHRRTF